MICAPGLNFDGTEGVGSRFHVLCSWTRFRRYRGRRVQFHCFALSESFWAVPRASSTVAMFCAPGLIFSGTKVTGSRFLVLRSWNHFGRYRGCRVPFSCFTLLDSFWTVPSVSGPVFLVLRSWTHFGRYRGNRVSSSCFTLFDSFWAVLTAPVPVFLFSAPGLIFGGTEGVGSHFLVCAPILVLRGTEGVWSRFQVLRSRTHFRRH
jgi:hypothetical protein